MKKDVRSAHARRLSGAAAILPAFSAAAWAQTPATPPPADNAAPQSAPTAGAPTTSGNSGPTTSYGIELLSGQGLNYDATKGLYVANGSVRVTYRNGTATGNRLVYNPRTHMAELTQDVTIQQQGQAYRAASVTLDTRTRLFTVVAFAGSIAPSALQNQVAQPLLVSGDLLQNTLRGEIQIKNGRVTSCDPPDYWIDSRAIGIIPGDRADFRDADLYFFRHRILHINHLEFSLRPNQRNQFLPAVGENEIEGYYAKERLPLGLGRLGAGLLLLDLMSKKGFGKGFEDAYRLFRGTGRFQVYQLRQKDTGIENLNGSLQDQRRIGDFTTTLNTNFSKNSYTQAFYTGSSQSTATGNFGLNRTTARSSTNLNLSLSNSQSSFSNNKNLNALLRQHLGLTKVLGTDFSVTRQLSAFGSGNGGIGGGALGGAFGAPGAASGQNEYQFTLTNSAPGLTTVFANDVHQPFGRNPLFFVERYPEFAFTTSSARLLPLPRLPSGQPLISATGAAKLPSNAVPAGPAPTTPVPGGPAAPGNTAPENALPGKSAPGGSATRSAAPGGSATRSAAPAFRSGAGDNTISGTAGSSPVPPRGASPARAGVPGSATTADAETPGTPATASNHAGLPGSRPVKRPPWWVESPVNFGLTLGHYREAPANTRLNRVDAILDGTIPQHPLIKGLSLAGNSRFEQKLTSDGTAQYVISLNDTMVHPFSREAEADASYYRIQPVGYTPFLFDRSGNVNTANLGLDIGVGQQPHAITSVNTPGALGYLSPVGGLGASSAYGGFASGYSSYGGGFPTGSGVNYGAGYSPGMGAGVLPALHIGAHTAFDFNAARTHTLGMQKWSPLALDLTSYPTAHTSFYASTTFTLNPSPFGGIGLGGNAKPSLFAPIRGGFRWIGGQNRFLDTSFVYDTSVKQLTTVRGHLLLPLDRLTRFEALAGYQKGFGGSFYDPFSGSFQQFLLTRDLNCFVANLFYSTNPHQINFSISLKLFPIQQLLGVQKFGNLFNGGVGQTF